MFRLLSLLLCLFVSSSNAQYFYQNVQVTVALTSFDPQACTGLSHDDWNAFNAFINAYTKGGPNYAGDNATTILHIAPGSVCHTGTEGPSIAMGYNMPNFVCDCTGVTFDGSVSSNVIYGTSLAELTQSDNNGAFIQTVQAGNKCVTLIDNTKSSLFTVGAYVYVGGLKLQLNSFPPDMVFWEWQLVTSIDSNTGIICFSAPLKNTYKSTWPLFNEPGNDNSGPGKLWFTGTGYGGCATFIGVTFSPNIVILPRGSCIKFINVTFTGPGFCPGGSDNVYILFQNVNMVNCVLEGDKNVAHMDIINSQFGTGEFPVMSLNVFCTNSSWSQLQAGTPQNFVGNNCNFNGGLNLSPNGYGVTYSFVCNNCHINPLTPAGNETIVEGTGAWPGVSISNGDITFPAVGFVAVPGLVDGAQYYVGDRFNCPTCQNYNEGFPFTVLNITQDISGNTVAHTDLFTKYGLAGWPAVPQPFGRLGMLANPAPQFTCNNCTGDPKVVAANGAPAGTPYGSYNSMTYSCGQMASAALLDVWGVLVKATYNVTVADQTQAALTVNAENVSTLNPTSPVAFNPIVNLKLGGIRTITSSGTSGGQSGDTLSSPGTNWFTGNDQFGINTGSNPANDVPCPSITITVQTNQSIH